MPGSVLLHVDGLTPAALQPSGPPPPFANLSWHVAPAEQVAVLGPAGAGKSTLLRATALLRPLAAGRVLFDGQDLARLKPAELRAARRRLPLVGGDPMRQFLPRITVAEALQEPLHIHQLGTPPERAARAAEALGYFGLNPGLLGRPVQMLSAGLRQAVALARGLILQPQLLLTDEIVDHLEPAAAAPLLERLAALCRTQGRAWVWTTSDAALAARFADRVMRLEAGRLAPA
jgi:ABC-type glutathione transport system ATPase component